MKLFTDQGNFKSLKVIAALELTGLRYTLEKCGHEDRVVPYLSNPSLPVLEVSPQRFLFSPNAATRYVLNKKSEEDDHNVDKWLEWESSQLQPYLVRYLVSVIVHKKPDTESLNRIQQLLKFLNAELKSKSLSKIKDSAADLVLWGSLFPVFKGTAEIKGWESQYSNIKTWFNSVNSLPCCQTALSKVIPGEDTTCLKGSLSAQPVPLLEQETRSEEPVQKAKPQKGKMEKPAENTTAEESLLVKEASPEEIQTAKESWRTGKSKCLLPRKRKHPILPNSGERNLLITSALPYVNNVPHLGNIIGCVLSADVFSRYCRLRNYNCLYICGTDEYGTATETKAIEEGLTPREICDKYNKIHTEIYEWFNISFDEFGRTSIPEQTKIAQEIFWKLENNGFILRDSIEQLQCQKCLRFLADRFVEGTCPLCGYDDARGDQCDGCGKLLNAIDLRDPKCKVCQGIPMVKSSQHLFLDLPKIESKLQTHLNTVFDKGIWTNNARVITNSWLRDGLKPRCISRDLKWGIPVPLEGFTDKVFYVWYDAPIGYISATACYTDQWEKWWKNPKQVELFNFLGKDNVPFHSVIFPSTLLGADDNYTIVNHMSATEYLNYEDTKFSKSRGTGVFGHQAKETGIPADVFRFYLLYVRPESQDSSFSWDDFQLKNNSELLNNLGNFINRALMFVSNNFGGQVQEMNLTEEDFNLLALVNRELQTYIDNMEQIKLRDSIRNILSISRLGNQYMQANKPWVLVKGSQTDKTRAGTVVSLSANLATLLSVLVQPYMPMVSATIQDQLKTPAECNIIHREFVCHLPPGHKIGKPSPLFEKIESSKIQEMKKRFEGEPAPQKSSKKVVSGSTEEIQKLNDEISAQGNVVRDLKAKKADKSVINVEVTKLLALKKKLVDISGEPAPGGGKQNSSQPKKASVKENKKAEVPAVNGAVDSKEVERLTEAVTKQGLKVRDLKSQKAEKSQIDSEVAALLDLKRQLAVAQGQDPEALTGGKGKKGKKK
ncbi:methionine--tRNA ligase, cytoplasmic-like [Saccostrea echinata]|uniref:methionine--tRNA ligase, cytoplasmic-like n=1 Tax=Saccostrea echinata TaxID=191078 RepID=UPI002A7FFB9A|nr:methionine--tRNA ligase, cytoplasmic-like [Saccostrea echinata]